LVKSIFVVESFDRSWGFWLGNCGLVYFGALVFGLWERFLLSLSWSFYRWESALILLLKIGKARGRFCGENSPNGEIKFNQNYYGRDCFIKIG